MKPMLRIIKAAACAGLLMFVICLSPVEGQSTTGATVVFSKGFADVKISGKDQFAPIVEGTKLGVGDVIRTDPEAEVEIRLIDKSVLKIGPSSQVVIKEMGTVEVTKVSTTTFELIKGKIRAVVSPLLKRESYFNIETTNATVGVRGTDFYETFDPDTGSTYVIGLEDCVSLSLKRIPGSAPIIICPSEELRVTGGRTPPAPAAASPETIKKILREMELKGGGSPGVPGLPPYITGAFVNRTIDLERLEGTLTLTKDDLNTDGKIIINGQSRDDAGEVTSVEVSTDGGMTFDKAAGTNSWTYEFSPRENIEYEIMVRAVNNAGLVSDPKENGPWTMLYKNVGNEDIVRGFLNAFIGGIKSEDVRSVEDVVADTYDGTVGGFYSKDELIRNGIEDLTGHLSGATIAYTVDQVSELSDRVVGVIHWTIMSGSTKDEGRTTWWLSRSDSFRLIHAEGDWLLRSIVTVEPGITLEVIDRPFTPPCDKAVKVLLVAPDVPYSVSSVTVNVQTFCGNTTVFLYRSYYETYVGDKNGFGSEVPVQIMSPSCGSPTCGIGYSPYLAANPYFACSFTDYGYDLTNTIMLP